MTYAAKILADMLGVPVQKTTDRRRRMESTVRTVAGPLAGHNPTNRTRAVVARLRDISKADQADPVAFERFVGDTLAGG